MSKQNLFLLILILLLKTGICQQNIQDKNGHAEPMYMLAYDHGGLILWGAEHFRERLENAESWLEKYPGFKIGLDNEAHM